MTKEPTLEPEQIRQLESLHFNCGFTPAMNIWQMPGFVSSIPGPTLLRPQVAHQRQSRCSTTPTAALGRTLVLGGNRGLGLELARALSSSAAADGAVCATVRPGADTASIAGVSGVKVVELNIRDRDAVVLAMKEFKPNVVFSCIGGNPGDEDRPDYPGNQNIIDAAEEVGANRFVLLSALGAGDSEGSVPFQVMDTMRPLLLDKSRAEVYLRESSLDWTIVRPCPFTDDEPTQTGMLTQGIKCYGTISRRDLAELLVRSADSVAAAGKTLTAIDRTRVLLTSPYVRPLEFWEPLPVDEFAL
jgi:nucleoside-diphosphate-sugar epimerase